MRVSHVFDNLINKVIAELRDRAPHAAKHSATERRLLENTAFINDVNDELAVTHNRPRR